MVALPRALEYFPAESRVLKDGTYEVSMRVALTMAFSNTPKGIEYLEEAKRRLAESQGGEITIIDDGNSIICCRNFDSGRNVEIQKITLRNGIENALKNLVEPAVPAKGR
jgi:hypothetical protein